MKPMNTDLLDTIRQLVEYKRLSMIWYADFIVNPEEAIREFRECDAVYGAYRDYCEDFGLKCPFDKSDFKSKTWEHTGITFIRVKLPKDVYNLEAYCNRIYLAYTKTEDSYDCPMFFLTEKNNELGTAVLNLIDFYHHVSDVGLYFSEEYNTEQMVEAYFERAKEFREQELTFRDVT